MVLVRQAAARAVKRVKANSSDSESEHGSSSGSEFKLSPSISEESDFHDEDSNASSDFNPFDDDSDCEGLCFFRNPISLLKLMM